MDIYISLAKLGLSKGGDITKQTKTPRALVYRILKSLQAKGLVESTMEFPARFLAVPFQDVIDLNIKSKLSDVARIRKDKKVLLEYWRSVDRPKTETSIEKFAIIEGKKKLFHKQGQLMAQAKSNFSILTTSQNLALADYFGVFEHGSNSTDVSCRFLIENSSRNPVVIKKILKKTNAEMPNIELRLPKVEYGLLPQMTICDNEEALYQITNGTSQSQKQTEELFLWTNCKSLIGAFSTIFEDLWSNSAAVKTTKALSAKSLNKKMEIIHESERLYNKYQEALQSAAKEVVIVTSSETSREINEIKKLLSSVQEGVNVKLMFPVTNDNKEAVQELLKKYDVRHVPIGYLAMTIIDFDHFFQFRTPTNNHGFSFEKAFYTTDSEYIKRAKKMINDIWEKAQKPSVITLQSILQARTFNLPNMMGAPFLIEEKPEGFLTEKEILQKIVNSRSGDYKDCNAIDRRFGTLGLAVIHPPKYLKLPDIMIIVNKIEKQSTLGEEDAIIFLSWLETPKGYAYTPVAIIGDNPKAHAFWKNMNSGNPAGQNTHLMKKDEIEIRIHGNTLFANWSVPVTLYPEKFTLPPACILIEGYGEVKTTAYTVEPPSGYRIKREENYLDAFVSFFHPSTKYSGPGTDGCLIRDSIITIYPPPKSGAPKK